MSIRASLVMGLLVVAACLPRLEIVDSLDAGGTNAGGSGGRGGGPAGAAGTSAGGRGASAGTSGGGGAGANGGGDLDGGFRDGGGGGHSGDGGRGGGSAGNSGTGGGGGSGGASGNGGGGTGGGGAAGAGGVNRDGGADARDAQAGAGGAEAGGGAGGGGGNGGGASGSSGRDGGSAGSAGTGGCGGGLPGGPWADWPMPNPPSSGLPNPQSYAMSQLVVRDNVTGLVWQRTADKTLRTWAEAPTYCVNLLLDGCQGWRLPSRIELMSIVDFSRSPPAIDVTAFPDTDPEYFWTSTANVAPTSVPEAHYVDFYGGASAGGDRRAALNVRCVR